MTPQEDGSVSFSFDVAPSLAKATLQDTFAAAEQAVLKAIAAEGCVPALSAASFIRRHGLPAPSTVRSAAANLERRDLIYRTESGFVVYDRLFGAFLAK